VSSRLQLGSLDVVGPFGDEQWERGKTIDDRLAGLGPSEPLEQFLEDQPGCEDAFTTLESVAQAPDDEVVQVRVASKRQRPNARLDKEIHERDRDAL
jgi:hypothetical protein